MEPIMRRAVGCLVVVGLLTTLPLLLLPTTAAVLRDDRVAGGLMLTFLAATVGAWNAEAFAIMRPRERVRDIGAMLTTMGSDDLGLARNCLLDGIVMFLHRQQLTDQQDTNSCADAARADSGYDVAYRWISRTD